MDNTSVNLMYPAMHTIYNLLSGFNKDVEVINIFNKLYLENNSN